MNIDNDLDPNRAQVRKTALFDGELIKREIHIAALQETRLTCIWLSRKKTTLSTGLVVLPVSAEFMALISCD